MQSNQSTQIPCIHFDRRYVCSLNCVHLSWAVCSTEIAHSPVPITANICLKHIFFLFFFYSFPNRLNSCTAMVALKINTLWFSARKHLLVNVHLATSLVLVLLENFTINIKLAPTNLTIRRHRQKCDRNHLTAINVRLFLNVIFIVALGKLYHFNWTFNETERHNG